MLDIRFIRENRAYVKAGLKNRGVDADIDSLIELDDQRRGLMYKTESMKAQQNAFNKEIPVMKKEGKDVKDLFAQLKELSENIKRNDQQVRELSDTLTGILMTLTNIPNERVPIGTDDSGNVQVAQFGEPRVFDFDPKAHWDIGKELGILDPETAAKVTGARFHFYRGLGARLERAIINFFLDTHTARGYTEILPPFLVNRDSMAGTGQLPKFEEDAFKIVGTDYFLIPTAEVPVTNIHRDEILSSEQLPVSYCAYSACFRAEAGSAGRDTRGLIRQHQFNKVELVKFCTAEQSYEELEKLTNDARYVLEQLELPYRVSLLCTGDMGFSSAMTYDIEVWMPSYGRYVEISSCSNFEDFQARRAKIRYKQKLGDDTRLVHTLNGSGVAVGRTVAAILENFQQADGSVAIPKVLAPYMGTEKISTK